GLRRQVHVRLLFAAVILIFAGSMILYYVIGSGSGLRLLSLVEKLLISPMAVISSDPSLNDRFAHIMVSFESMFFGHGWPFGFSSWNSYLFDRVRDFS